MNTRSSARQGHVQALFAAPVSIAVLKDGWVDSGGAVWCQQWKLAATAEGWLCVIETKKMFMH